MASEGTFPEPNWRSSVSIVEEPEIATELAARLPPTEAPRSVSVTDLLEPRRAYWRAVAPVPMDELRRGRVEQGRTFHRRLGRVLAAEGALEARVRGEGAVGRIDVLSDVPIEVKTSSATVPVHELASARPEHVEQLAVYCALADRPMGRLVTVALKDGHPGRVQVAEVSLGDLVRLRSETAARVASLRRAWSSGDPGELPPCRWYDRGCEYQGAGVCDCRRGPRGSASEILDGVREIRERADVEERLVSQLAELPPESEPLFSRFRDLVYPRRVYFERSRPAEEADGPPFDPRSAPDLFARLTFSVEAGPVGDVTTLPSASGDVAEDVAGFRGAPYLVRTSRAWDPPTVGGLVESHPQYAMELGFRCVATGRPSALLVLGRERGADAPSRVRVFRYRYEPASSVSRLWRARSAAFRAALLASAPATLPSCPAWMARDCPYRSECGCDVSGTRSQR